MSATLVSTENDRTITLTATVAGQTVFPFDFPAQSATDIRVEVALAATPTAFADLSYAGGAFAVTGLSIEAGGSVTLATGRAVGDKVRISGDTAISRSGSVVAAGRFSSDAIDTDLDRSRMIEAELRRDLDPVIAATGALDAAVEAAEAARDIAVPAAIAAEAARSAAELARAAAEEAAQGAEGLFATEEEAVALTVTARKISPWSAGKIIDKLTARVCRVEDYASVEAAAAAAYASGRLVSAPSSTIVYLDCNPSAGDDIQAMLAWCQRSHLVYPGNLRLRIADGLHQLNTYADIYGPVYICGSANPEYIALTAATITSLDSNTYEALITVASALPARVTVNYAIGISNAQGTNGCNALNGAHQVTWIAADRLSFKTQFRAYGVAPTTGVLDSTVTLGLTPNQVVIPFCCLRVQAGTTGGWDGAAREGFLNFFGGYSTIDGVGISYNGVSSEHDILFTRSVATFLYLLRSVIAGAGDKVLRSGFASEIFANLSCFGGGLTGAEIWQGAAGSRFAAQRIMAGSVSTCLFTPTVDCSVWLTASVLAGAPAAVKPTYVGSIVTFGSGRVAHCDDALYAQNGDVNVTAATTVTYCTNPVTIGTNGAVYGLPTLVANTNTPAEFRRPRALAPVAVSVTAPGAITDGTQVSSGPYAVPGAAIGDQVRVVNASASFWQAGLDVQGHVTAAGQVTIYWRAFAAGVSVTGKNVNIYVTKAS